MTTSRLQPDIVSLDKGLNLQAAKIAAPPGAVLDSLNYEHVDFIGQKRIDGYVRYDGSLGSYQDVIYRLYGDFEGSMPSPGDLVSNEDEQLVGVITAFGTEDGRGYIDVAIINNNLIPKSGDLLSAGEVQSVHEIKELQDYEGQYETILDANATLRARVTDLPGPIAGLHWFGDRLYAVASVLKINAGSHSYMPNDVYRSTPDGDIIVLKTDGPYVYLGTSAIAPGAEHSDMASFFQSRTEQQALDELGDATKYGWSFVHQGWSVPFERGVSLYGSLPALNLNIQGIGVSGSTPITGDNGRALSLVQKVASTNLNRQVNGWKTSSSPGVYNLEASALTEVDTLYIYADAYFSWNGDTGAVEAPGVSSPLEEYPANNSVVVEV